MLLLPFESLGHLPPLSSTNRYTRAFHLHIDISRSGAGLWNSSSGLTLEFSSVVDRIITRVCPLFLFRFWNEHARVCVERFARRTLYFFFFFLRYSRASPPRYITFVWSFFGLSNGFATLRGVHSARKETWCSGKSRKSRKSGSLYSVQRVGSVVVLFHSRCTCPIWGREKIYYTVLRYQIVRGKKLKIYEKVNLSLKMIRTRVIW